MLDIQLEQIFLVHQFANNVFICLLLVKYDFRLSSYDTVMVNGMYSSLKGLVETSYAKNGKPAVFVCHSMGAAYLRHFLAEYIGNTDSGLKWKEKYVKCIIAGNGILFCN
jgi:hypothetical protein